jgi:hypothetical protein
MPIDQREFFRLFDSSPVKVTPHAQRLIFLIVQGVYADPSPTWIVPRGTDLDAVARRIASGVPSLITEIFQSNRQLRDRSISTFDVLHWLSTSQGGRINLDCVCPFEK